MWRRSVRGPAPGRWRWVVDLLVAAAILALFGLIALRLDQVETRKTSGRPTVVDGDTLTLSGERIRLKGIDAPEYNQICRRNGEDYRCGQSARTALVALIGGRPVECTGWERDRYGRFLGSCSAGSTDLNRALVAKGWAIAYGDFEAEEALAREERAGLWAGEFDRPRQWREMHGGMIESVHDLTGAILNWLCAVFQFS